MDLRRLRVGEWITALAGVALLVSLFLPWYGARSPERATTESSGFEALAVLDVVLALVAAAAVALLVITATQRLPAVPLGFNVFLVLAALLALLLVVWRVLDLPGDAGSREWGLWLGLAGALGILVGGMVALRDDRRPHPGRSTDLSGRPAPPPEQIELIPAPPRDRDLQSRG